MSGLPGSALADGADCSYLCDVAVYPRFQGIGLGKAIVTKLMELSAGHKKIILYASPGREGFYKTLGFKPMRTAMAIFQDQKQAVREGWFGRGSMTGGVQTPGFWPQR